jgi:hypothetical protein
MKPKIKEEKIYEVKSFCNIHGTEWLKGMLLTEDEIKLNHIPFELVRYLKTEKIIINKFKL